MLGAGTGWSVGEMLGAGNGLPVGDVLGAGTGWSVGGVLGAGNGLPVGDVLGAGTGWGVGFGAGMPVGPGDGTPDGCKFVDTEVGNSSQLPSVSCFAMQLKSLVRFLSYMGKPSSACLPSL